MSLELIGIGKEVHLAYGRCHVEFIDLREVGRVLLSYAWEDEVHNQWVESLADRLTKEGISVLFDRYDVQIGNNIQVYMEHQSNVQTRFCSS